jgi:hypothetical protein
MIQGISALNLSTKITQSGKFVDRLKAEKFSKIILKRRKNHEAD